MQKVIFLIGLPNSGKTTFVESQKYTFRTISFDHYIISNFSPNYNEAWVKYQTLLESEKAEIYQTIDKQFMKALNSGRDIVIDFTNLARLERKKWFDLIGDKKVRKIARIFQVDFDEILDRNKKRKDKFIPRDVLMSMRDRYEYPLIEEGFDSITWERLGKYRYARWDKYVVLD